jgi:hypothetical protein
MLRKQSEAGNFDYFLISDVPDTFRCDVTCDIYTLSGVKIKSFQIAHTLNGNQRIKINATEKIGNVTDSNYVINFQWNNSRNEKKSRWYSEIKQPYPRANLTDFKLEIVEVDSIHKSAKLRFYTPKYVGNCWFTAELFGTHFTENFEDYLPGIHEVSFEYEQLPAIKDISIHWM